jgi:phage terminase small subunit
MGPHRIKTLTPKQEKFCREIVSGKNQSDAYRAAYNTTKMSNESVWTLSSRLMTDVKVKARIQEFMAPVVAKVQLSRAEWLSGLERIARGVIHADVRKLFDPVGNVVEVKEIGDHEEVLIESVEVDENFVKVGDKAEHVGYTKKIKLASRVKGVSALIEIGKVMGWVESDNKPAESSGLVVIIERQGGGGSSAPPTIDVTPRAAIQPTGVSQRDPMPDVVLERV